VTKRRRSSSARSHLRRRVRVVIIQCSKQPSLFASVIVVHQLSLNVAGCCFDPFSFHKAFVLCVGLLSLKVVCGRYGLCLWPIWYRLWPMWSVADIVVIHWCQVITNVKKQNVQTFVDKKCQFLRSDFLHLRCQMKPFIFLICGSFEISLKN